ncbi:MAG: SDR family NAD(P)-dependent oxidoreductase, partial [Gammaproteobacteria bacterium]|nr:SDR family NAD(P)-dependent oxidoreductase [Gammaproteobacteria bacterium]
MPRPLKRKRRVEFPIIKYLLETGMNIENKVAIVTGGSRDIGRAVSETLAANGAKVAFTWLNSAEDGEATLAAIQSNGGTAISVRGDMTDSADVENLIDRTRNEFGDSIDILV